MRIPAMLLLLAMFGCQEPTVEQIPMNDDADLEPRNDNTPKATRPAANPPPPTEVAMDAGVEMEPAPPAEDAAMAAAPPTDAGSEEEDEGEAEPPTYYDVDGFGISGAGLGSRLDRETMTLETTDEITPVDGGRMRCSTQKVSMKDAPETWVTMGAARGATTYPGAALNSRAYLDGTLRPVRFLPGERQPVSLSLDVLSNANSVTVEAPSYAAVQTAIGRLATQNAAAGTPAAGALHVDIFKTSSTRAAFAMAGFASSFAGGELEVDSEFEDTSDTTNLTVLVQHRLFTAHTEYPDGMARLSEDRLQTLTEAGELSPELGDLLVVSDVSYGSLLIIKVQSREETALVWASLNAAIEGLGGDHEGWAESDIDSTLSEMKIEVTSLGNLQGVVEGQVKTLLEARDLSALFDGDPTPLTAAAPISFRLRNWSDWTIAALEETTEFEVRVCTMERPWGGRYRVLLDEVVVPADCDGPTAGAGDMYGWFNVAGRKVHDRGHHEQIGVSSGNSYFIAPPGFPAVLVKDYGFPSDAKWIAAFGTGERVLTVPYGEQLVITGDLRDADNGSDAIVGKWNISIDPRGHNGGRAVGTNHCDNDPKVAPELIYTVEQLEELW